MNGPPWVPELAISVPGETCRVGPRTVSEALRVWFPWPFVVLLKLIVAGYVPGPRLLALAFTVNVMAVGVVVAVPDVADGVSQLGRPVIWKPTLPLDVLTE